MMVFFLSNVFNTCRLVNMLSGVGFLIEYGPVVLDRRELTTQGSHEAFAEGTYVIMGLIGRYEAFNSKILSLSREPTRPETKP